MTIRSYDINLDSFNATIPEPIVGRQGDRNGAVTLNVTLSDRGNPIYLSGQTINLMAETANGTAIIADNGGVTITDATNGKFTYAVPNALWSEAGKIKNAYFSLTDNKGQQTTYDLIFIVKKAIDINQEKADDYIAVIDGTIRELKAKLIDIGSGSPKGVYATLDDLKAAYPNGTNGIYIVKSDNHWYYYNAGWQDGGQYISNLEYGNGFLKGNPVLNNSATQVLVTKKNGSECFRISGTDTTTANKGIHYISDSYNFSEITKQPIDITIDIVSEKSQRIGVGINYYDASGSSLGTEVLKKIDLPSEEAKHIRIVKQANKALATNAKQYSFYFTSASADMPTWYIATSVSGTIKGDIISDSPLNGEMIANPDFTQDLSSNVTPNNTATTIRTVTLEGRNWLAIEGDTTTVGKGVYWTIRKSDYDTMFYFPIVFKLKYQLTVMQNLSIEATYFDSSDKKLGSEVVAKVIPDSLKYSEERFKFVLNKNNYTNVSYIHLSISNKDSGNIGRILITDVSTKIDYNYADFGINNLISKSTITPQSNTEVEYGYENGNLANKIIVTGTSDTSKYKGFYFSLNTNDAESYFDYPIFLKSIFKSTIDQTLEISLQYLDGAGNKLGTTSGEYVVLNKGIRLFKTIYFNLDNKYQATAKTIKLLIIKSAGEPLGTIELDDPVIGHNYNAGLIEPSSVMQGKTMNIIGDSYVANNGEPVARTWHFKLAHNNSMNYNNYGINGNGLVSTAATDIPVVERYTQMDNNADYIIVVGGKNDYNQQMPIADFKSGIDTLILGLTQKYLGKKICFFTPWSDQGVAHDNPIALHEYANAIEEECEKYGIPCFNSSKKGGMATYNADFRAKYFQSADDTSHLNADGHDLFLNKAQKFIESL